MELDARTFLEGLFAMDSITVADPLLAASESMQATPQGYLAPADLPERWREYYEERAAVREYEGGKTREHAEAEALAETFARMTADGEISQKRLIIPIDMLCLSGYHSSTMGKQPRRTDLAGKLRVAFVKSGLSRFALAKQTGLPYSVVFRFIAGERDLTLRTASKLCDVLGLELTPRRKHRR